MVSSFFFSCACADFETADLVSILFGHWYQTVQNFLLEICPLNSLPDIVLSTESLVLDALCSSSLKSQLPLAQSVCPGCTNVRPRLVNMTYAIIVRAALL